MSRVKRAYVIVCIAVALLVLHQTYYGHYQTFPCSSTSSSNPAESSPTSNGLTASGSPPINGRSNASASKPVAPHVVLSYSESIKRVHKALQDSTYRFDRAKNLPLLNLTPQQQNRTFRISEGKKWLKTQRLVVAASVRTTMHGLVSSVEVMRSLGTMFESVTAVFVENDSTDRTRGFLYELTKRNTDPKFRVFLLGCDSVNSEKSCNLNISYLSSGRQHREGVKERAGRNTIEESIDRGLVMAALRNTYLQFIYDNIDADLLLVLEADMRWKPFDLDSVAQGVYHFHAKPKLDSVCAYARYAGHIIQDPCTLIFFHNKQFYVDSGETQFPFIDRIDKHTNQLFRSIADSVSGKGPELPPVKVAACFQGVAFYRMHSLKSAQVFYKYREGEWHCEHSTLSMQLKENYLDTQMRPLIN